MFPPLLLTKPSTSNQFESSDHQQPRKKGRRDPSCPLAVVLRSRKSNPAELVSEPEETEVKTPSEPQKSTFNFSTMKVIQRGSYSLRNVANRQRAAEESYGSKKKESGWTNTTGNVKSVCSGKRGKKRKATMEESEAPMDILPARRTFQTMGFKIIPHILGTPPDSHASSTVVDAADCAEGPAQNVNEHEAGVAETQMEVKENADQEQAHPTSVATSNVASGILLPYANGNAGVNASGSTSEEIGPVNDDVIDSGEYIGMQTDWDLEET
ncbi:hypothetical protein HDU76_011059, partial [Blyttiomyces sp. JEL0837]